MGDVADDRVGFTGLVVHHAGPQQVVDGGLQLSQVRDG